MSALVDRPPTFTLVIPQGQHLHKVLLEPMVDAATGAPFDFTDDPAGEWTARMDVIKADGTPVVSFATSGESGVITLDADGFISFDMAAEFTDDLDPTTEYAGALHGPLHGDVVLTDPADGEPWLFFKGDVLITRKVTSS